MAAHERVGGPRDRATSDVPRRSVRGSEPRWGDRHARGAKQPRPRPRRPGARACMDGRVARRRRRRERCTRARRPRPRRTGGPALRGPIAGCERSRRYTSGAVSQTNAPALPIALRSDRRAMVPGARRRRPGVTAVCAPQRVVGRIEELAPAATARFACDALDEHGARTDGNRHDPVAGRDARRLRAFAAKTMVPLALTRVGRASGPGLVDHLLPGCLALCHGCVVEVCQSSNFSSTGESSSAPSRSRERAYVVQRGNDGSDPALTQARGSSPFAPLATGSAKHSLTLPHPHRARAWNEWEPGSSR